MELLVLSSVIEMHQKHLNEIVAKSNQLIENFQTLNNFVNELAKKINEMNDEIMELAREVYKNEIEELS
jgi:peptidoglycan hydrolase CwlO-like protein